MRKLFFFTRAALQNMTQNIFINLVSIGTLSLSLLILSAFVLINSNIQKQLELSTHDVSVSVYLKDGLKKKELADLNKKLSVLPNVAEVSYLSKADALADLRNRLGSHGGLLEGLEKNPLPASFELKPDPKFKSKKHINEMISLAGKLNGVDEVSYAWEWAEKITGLLNFIKLGGLIIGGLLFLATVFIISNTIRLTVYSRQEEISIMFLIGATKNFIRMPFYVEGFLQGLAGGVLALIFLFIVFTFLASGISLPLGLSMGKLSFLSASTAVELVAAGVLMGLLGSAVSLGRFFK